MSIGPATKGVVDLHWHEQHEFWNRMCVDIVDVQHIELLAGERLSLPQLTHSVFIFGLKGSAETILEDRVQQIHRFCVLHGGSGNALQLTALDKGFVCYAVAYRALAYVAEAELDVDPTRMRYAVSTRRPLAVMRLFAAMHGCWQQAGPIRQLQLRGYFNAFLQELLQPGEQGSSDVQPDVIVETLHYLQGHFLESISLEQLSSQTGSSTRHLARLFKSRTGLSPIDYILRLRMDYAKQLLQATDATIEEIAHGIGYADSYSFSKRFKKHTGLPPNRYRGESAAYVDFPQARRRAIRHAPCRPKRIVALYLLGDVLSFDVTPVGVSDVYEGSSLRPRFNDAVSLGVWHRPDLLKIRDLQPDLVIAPSHRLFERLRGLAPVVYVDYEWPLAERMSRLSEWLGPSSDFGRRMDYFQEKLENSKNKLRQAGLLDKTVTIVEGGNDGVEVIASKSFGRGSQIVYEYLGMKAPAKLQQMIEQATQARGVHASFDQLEAYAGDFIFRSSYSGMPDLSAREEWNRLPSVREGRVLDISFGLSYFNDLFSLDRQLSYIVDRLLAFAR